MTITVFCACGTGESSSQSATTIKSSGFNLNNIINGLLTGNILNGPASNWGGFAWEVGQGVDQTAFNAVQIPYPAAGFFLGSPTTYLESVAKGVANGANLIANCGTHFILVGYSQGAQVVSELYQELQTGGSLASYGSSLLGGVTFGNPMRNPGHSWPNDPTGCNTGGANPGQGINSYTTSSGTLSGTAGTGLLPDDMPASWWDFTNQYDLAGNIPIGGAGQDIADVWTAMGGASFSSVLQIVQIAEAVMSQTYADPLASLIDGLLTNPISSLANAATALSFLGSAVTDIATLGHTSFNSTLIGSTGLTSVQLAINYINSFAL